MKTKIFLISALITVNQCWGTCGEHAPLVLNGNLDGSCTDSSQCSRGYECNNFENGKGYCNVCDQ